MQCQILNMRSKNSSSSSGSLKLISDIEMERHIGKNSPRKDLFDLLIAEDDNSSSNQDLLRTISELNLSPRQLATQGCKCSKIDCLKMYCECFAKGRMCTDKCQCTSCCNHEGCQIQIYKARQMANFRHPGTFKGIPAFVPERRCTCKKSSCMKNYCDCYRAGLKCTEQCECLSCQNGKPHDHDYFDSRMQIEVNA